MTTPTPAPFSLSLTPVSQAITSGQTVTVTGMISRGTGYTAAVSLSASAPAGLTATLSQTGDSFALSVVCAADAVISADGVAITVTGTAGTTTASASCRVVGPVRYNQFIADMGHDGNGNAWVLINLYDTRTNVYQLDSSGKPLLDPVTKKPIPLSPLPAPLVTPFRVDGLISEDPTTVWVPRVNTASVEALKAAAALTVARTAIDGYLGVLLPVQGLP